jgi:hypothetical protein
MIIITRNDIWFNHTPHYAIEHNVLNCEIQHKKTQYRQLALALNAIMLSIVFNLVLC